MFEIAHPTAGLPQSHYCCQHQRNVPGTVCLIDSDDSPESANPVRTGIKQHGLVSHGRHLGLPHHQWSPQNMGNNPVLSTQQTHVDKLLIAVGDLDSVVISPPPPIRIFFRYWSRRVKIKTPSHHEVYDAHGWASKSFLGLRAGRTQLTGKRKHRLFRDRRHLLHRGEPALGQPLQHPIHQDFRHRRTRRHPNGRNPIKP